MSALYLGLVHYPVRARGGETVATAITNLDVHDLARLARTYGASAYFVVSPIAAQREIVARILAHWREGEGAARIPERGEALRLVRAVASVEEAAALVAEREGRSPRRVATAARGVPGSALASFTDEAARLRDPAGPPLLLLFGTGHGLADRVLAGADALLAPVRPGAGYNHLSVRTAAAIVLDRLLGEGAPAT